MTIDELMDALQDEISGNRVKATVGAIAQHHRIQGSSGFRDAINAIRGELTLMGVDSQIREYPADGETRNFAFTAPHGWNIRGGDLKEVKPQQRTINCFEDTPVSVIAHSGVGRLDANVVDVGDGTSKRDYAGLDVRGKFVMCTGPVKEAMLAAVENGAAGVIHHPPDDQIARTPDVVQYLTFWPDASQIDHLPLGFSISRRQAHELRAKLETSEVWLEGFVDAEFTKGPLQILDAAIEGERPDAREVLLMAHLCHPRPSANDNASGSALLLEIIRVVKRLVANGALRLKYRLRAIWVPEISGLLYLMNDSTGNLDKVVYGVNLDMVGQSPDQLGEPLRISEVPLSMPGFLNSCFEPLLEMVASDPRSYAVGGSRRQLVWEVTVPDGGSDHFLLTDPAFRIPIAMFCHRDPFHHTSLDTVDMVDPTELKRVGLLCAGVCLVPQLGEAAVERLYGWLCRYAMQNMTRAFELAQGTSVDEGTVLLGQAYAMECSRFEAFKVTFQGSSAPAGERSYREALRAVLRMYLQALGPLKMGRSESLQERKAVPETAARVPVKVTEGPLPASAIASMAEDDRRFIAEFFCGSYYAVAGEALNLCDGENTVEAIAAILSLEFRRLVSVEQLSRALDIFENGGWIEYR